MNFKKSSYPKSAKTIEWLPAFGNFVITSQRRVLIFKEIPVKLRPSWVRWNMNREIYSQFGVAFFLQLLWLTILEDENQKYSELFSATVKIF